MKLLQVVAICIGLFAVGTAYGEEELTGNPELDAQITAAQQEHRQLAAKWAKRAELESLDDQIVLAIDCLRTAPGGGSDITETEFAVKMTTEAGEFLKANAKAAKPHLLKFLSEVHPFELGDWRMCQVVALVGEYPDRDLIVPLVEKMLTCDESDYAPIYISLALGELNDADLAQQLLRAYAWEENTNQDRLLSAAGHTPSVKVVPQLKAWHEMAVATKASYSSAAWPLGECEKAKDREYQFNGPNEALRKFIDDRIAVRKLAMLAGRSEFGVQLNLTTENEKVKVGEKPGFTLKLTNTTDKPVTLMRSRDGSEVGWLMPKILVAVRGPDHKPVNLMGGRCGNTGPLQKEDIITIAPGKSYDLLAGGFQHYVLQRFAPKHAGKYQVHVTYDTTSVMGDGNDKQEILQDVLPVSLKSNTVVLHVEAAE